MFAGMRFPVTLGEAESRQRVAGFTRLADDDDEVLGVEDGVMLPFRFVQ